MVAFVVFGAGAGQRLPPEPAAARRRRVAGSLEIFPLLFIAMILARLVAGPLVGSGAMSTWLTIFAAVNVQALPFVLLGVAGSGLVAAYVPGAFLARALPKRPSLAVPVAGPAGSRYRAVNAVPCPSPTG